MTITHPGFLADILANPEDDTPRLIYADWLMENGQPERAEFIRVQVELAGLDCSRPRCDRYEDQMGCSCEECTRYYRNEAIAHPLRRRERELFGRLCVRLDSDLPEPLACCVPCWDLGNATPRAVFRRGFVAEVHAPLQSLIDHLPALVRQHPLERARATDRIPLDVSGGVGWRLREEAQGPAEHWYWLRATGVASLDWELPGWLWDLLPGDGSYCSTEDAHAALSDVLLAWANLPDAE